MSGRPGKFHGVDLTRAAFLCVALVLLAVVLSALLRAGTAKPAPSPSPSPTPAAGDETVVALFASASDPLCGPLYDSLDEFCAQKGWRLITYDCRSNAKNQIGQIEDFLRKEEADIAVLYSFLEQMELNDQIKALGKVCKVVTLGQRSGTAVARHVSCHIGVDEDERLAAAAQCAGTLCKKDQGALLLLDFPDKTWEPRLLRALDKENVTVLDQNYSWDWVPYSERYLEKALPAHPDAGVILCASSHGSKGAVNLFRQGKTWDPVKIVSMTYEAGMAEEIALGKLDAALAARSDDLERMVGEALEKIQKGEKAEDGVLPIYTVTAENADDFP